MADFLVENEYCEDKEEALEGLRRCREFYGWMDCIVSDTIEELVNIYYGVLRAHLYPTSHISPLETISIKEKKRQLRAN